jgi:hypothetical protein
MLATAGLAFVLSGVVALALAVLSGQGRLGLGAVAAVSGALALLMLRLDRRSGPEPPPQPPQVWDAGHLFDEEPDADPVPEAPPRG